MHDRAVTAVRAAIGDALRKSPQVKLDVKISLITVRTRTYFNRQERRCRILR